MIWERWKDWGLSLRRWDGSRVRGINDKIGKVVSNECQDTYIVRDSFRVKRSILREGTDRIDLVKIRRKLRVEFVIVERFGRDHVSVREVSEGRRGYPDSSKDVCSDPLLKSVV